MIVAAGLAAYGLLFLRPLTGGVTAVLLAAVIILAVAILSCAALREFLPVRDPRHAEADRFVVWGGFAIALAMGWQSFGIWFPPGLVLGTALLWWRARELFEVFPWLDGPVRRVASKDVWVAYAPELEQVILPQTEDVLRAIVELARY